MRRHRQFPGPDSGEAEAASPRCHGNGRLSPASLSAEFARLAQGAWGHVACGLAFILCMSQCGIFDVVQTDTGLSHYAERHSVRWLPVWLPMPFNAAVNAGYSLCGIHWLVRARRLYLTGRLSRDSAYLFCAFAAMATVYGPVQLARIIRMSHSTAVVDQWVTLPFFAWVPVWVVATATGRFAPVPALAVMVTSLLSYLLAVVTDLGFELALTLHVAAALGSGIFLCLYPSLSAPGLVPNVALAAVSCAGFVGLKLLDHELAQLSGLFRVVSGHFLSKLADVMQIHFVCRAFECVAVGSASGAVGKSA